MKTQTLVLSLLLMPLLFGKPGKRAVLFDACEAKMQETWLQGVKHFEADENVEAMALFKKMDKECPKSLSAKSYIALINRMDGNYDAALEIYEKMLVINPKNAKVIGETYDTCLEGAEFDLDREKWDAMEKKLNRAVEFRPETVEVLGIRSQSAILRKDFKGCVNYTSKILAKNPQDADAYFDRATCRANMQDLTNALVDISQALRMNPETEWYVARAGMYAAMNRCPDAMRDIATAKKTNLDDEVTNEMQKVQAQCQK